MAIPDYQSIMLPLLKFVGDEREYSLREVTNALAKQFLLNETDLQELLPSGKQGVFINRVGWARTYLSKAELLVSTKRGFFKISNRGVEILNQNLPSINNKILKQFPEFNEFQNRKNEKFDKANVKVDEEDENKTPEESLEIAYRIIRVNLAIEIVEKIKSCSPNFFEFLVVDLLVKMGYGGTREDAGERLGKSGDGGIDGIIKEDRLGLDVIYLQAKRWENIVGRPEIQKFAGALQEQRARKGVFITTSDFTREAREFAAMIDSKIILIDGEQLAELMIDYNVGVANATVYEIKRIDSDYFLEG